MSVAPAVRPARHNGVPQWVFGVFGLLVLLVVWEVLGRTVFAESRVVPPPTAIANQLFHDGLAFYWPNVRTTLREAGLGWLWGNAIAIVLAVVFVQIPLVERALLQLALVSYCLPVIAIGPVLAVLFNGDTSKVILAALSVIFTTLVGGSWTQLWTVRLRASLPSLFAGLRIAAPAAMLGAIIGEYLGAESGLGVAMINSQQSLAVERTWGIALVATALSGAAYGLTALIGRLLTPWAPRAAR